MNTVHYVIVGLLCVILALQIYIILRKSKCKCEVTNEESNKGSHERISVSEEEEDECYGKKDDPAYACPDTDEKGVVGKATLCDGVVATFTGATDVQKWVTPDTDHMFTYVSPHLSGPLVTVLLTKGTCNKTDTRPPGTFYNCSPMDELSSHPGVCSSTKACTINGHANYTNSGMDQGHMISNHEAGLFTTGGEQSSFSMCNIWPQGKDFNEHKWQKLEYTCDAYCLTRKCAVLSGPIFSDGTDTCIQPELEGVGECSEDVSTLKVPSHFFKVLIDLDEEIFWTFLAKNNLETADQTVSEMFSSLADVNGAVGAVTKITIDKKYQEQKNLENLPEASSAPQCD